MERRIISIALGILFSVSFLATVFSLTTLSKNFVKMVMKKNNYYEIVSEKINDNDFNIIIDKSDIKKDIDKYINSRYKNTYIKVPSNIDNKEFRDVYNKYIKFDDFFIDCDIYMIISFIYIVDIILIILTGILFNKTKNIHNINTVVLTNFIMSIIIFGLIKVYLNIDNFIINEVIKTFNNYYLGASIILLEMLILKKIKTKFL
ncbi:MAG: hypothetical protein J1F35_07735 [Erysipelotrichales bacterium]|nr:hypothetical protein [Erysipelotrichales bacterium]